MGFLRKEKSKTPLITAVLLSVAVSYAAGYYKAADSTLAFHYEKVAKAEKVSYELGKRDQNWKQLIHTDQDAFNKACSAWWFDSTVKDRQIRKPK